MTNPSAHAGSEFTLRALLMGTLLGILFGASSLYLVLKVGLTVSASIPVAVVGIALFRLGSRFGGRDSSLHENNIVQTAGSAGESIAFGLGVTMPAILVLGFDLEIWRVMLVGTLGALLGILMMIPLRRTLIVQMRDTLKYPEGTACAQVLLANERAKAAHAAGHRADRRAHLIFLGFFVGLGYKVANVALKAWKEVPQTVFGAPLKGGAVGAEISPELLGVGYIIGPRIAATMCAGGVLSYLLLIPMIRFFGAGLDAPLFPGAKLIGEMTPAEIRSAYILYIGAGAVAAGGLIALVRALPTIWRSIRSTLSRIDTHAAHTDQDIPLRWVLIGCIAILTVITLAEPLHMNLVGALLILLFGFLFVTVSSRLAGEIGMTTNPISGMTVATLLFTSALFLLVGWTGSTYYVTALSVGAIVSIAACNAGATSQDLKTGYLVGATPRLQQYAILIGAFATALALGPILLKLNDTGTVYVPLQGSAIGVSAETAQSLPREQLPALQGSSDTNSYRVWHNTDATRGAPGKYLLNESGGAIYYVDPGINGSHTTRPDGTEAPKFDAPKTVLMSYVIKGMLDRKLPWELVILGAMLAVILEMARVPSLPFAVGVYLPLASSLPIFIGGALRWLVDRRNHPGVAEEQRFAQGDHGPGVLLASGYIAGGALAGIVIAFSTGILGEFSAAVTQYMRTHNPFYAGDYADLLALIPFALLAWLLWRKGRTETAES
jgi:putative OPT family oligopeptide transporter